MPFAAIACQARGFQPEYRPHRARTDRAYYLLESAPLHQSRSGPSQILINHGDLLETQLTRVVFQGILPPPTLLVMQHLARCRLANIDDRSALQSFSGQLGVHEILLPPRAVRGRRRAAVRSEPESVVDPCREAVPAGRLPAAEG